MEIKFIVNGKSFTTLCKTVKSAEIFTAELSDFYGYTAFVTVDRITGVIYINKVNNEECHISGNFVECGSTENGFKRNVVNFLIRFVRGKERDFYLLDEENILFHLSKAVREMAREVSDTEEIEETASSSDEVEKTLGHVTYGEKKLAFSSDESCLTKEILHKLIELYDDGITPDKIWMKGKTFTPIEFIDFLYAKEVYSAYEKGFFHIYHGYASKMLLIDANKSNIFNKWSKIAPISKSAFLEGVRWICGDTSPEESHYTRAIALTPDGIVKLTATHSSNGYTFFDERGKMFSGAHFTRKAVPEKEKIFADEKGEISSFCKIILSSKDRV